MSGEIVLNDTELSKLLASKHGLDLCWTDGTGWMQYPAGGNRWVSIAFETLIKVVADELHGLYKIWGAQTTDATTAKRLSVLLTTSKVKSVAAQLAGRLERNDAEFDTHPYLLNTINCVVDLRTGATQSHDPVHLFTKVAGAQYRSDAQDAAWTQALGAIPADTIDWLQQRIGQAAIGTIEPQGLLLVFHGSGANGKTTILSGCRDALGDFAMVIPDKVIMANHNDHTTELTTLKGARFALIEETAEARRLNVARIKKLVETPEMSARRIRENEMSWKSTHTIFLTTNYKPIIEETDEGTWRRLALVTFPLTFTPSDLRERTKQKSALEACLAWIVQGAVAFHTAPLDIPSLVSTDTESWRAETDLIMAFLRDRIEFEPTSQVLATELYTEFSNHIRAAGQAHWSDRSFSQRFGSHDHVKNQHVSKSRTKSLTNLSRPFAQNGAPQPAEAVIWTGLKFKDNSDQTIYEATLDWPSLIRISNGPEAAA